MLWYTDSVPVLKLYLTTDIDFSIPSTLMVAYIAYVAAITFQEGKCPSLPPLKTPMVLGIIIFDYPQTDAQKILCPQLLA